MSDRYSVGTSNLCPCPAQAVLKNGWDDAFGVTIEYDKVAQEMPSFEPDSGRGTVNERDARRAWIAAMHLYDRKVVPQTPGTLDSAKSVARTLGWLS